LPHKSCIFRTKVLKKCCFYKEVVQKLKFPNNSIPLNDVCAMELKISLRADFKLGEFATQTPPKAL